MPCLKSQRIRRIQGCGGRYGEVLALLRIDQRLQHLIGRGDDLGIGLVGPLRDDQIGEFLRDVDGRALERGGGDLTGGAGAGLAQQEGAGVVGLEVDVAGLRREAVGVGECRDRD